MIDHTSLTRRAWPPYQSYEESTEHKNGIVTIFVRHWIFGKLVYDSFPKKEKS